MRCVVLVRGLEAEGNMEPRRIDIIGPQPH